MLTFVTFGGDNDNKKLSRVVTNSWYTIRLVSISTINM